MEHRGNVAHSVRFQAIALARAAISTQSSDFSLLNWASVAVPLGGVKLSASGLPAAN
jgi:hypothetical protein